MNSNALYLSVADTTRKNTKKYKLQNKVERKGFINRKRTKENKLQ